MKLQDDRTEEQKKTHRTIVLGTDSFMSGWGEAEGGPSYAGWVCEDGNINACESWVRGRGDISGSELLPVTICLHLVRGIVKFTFILNGG